jgi:hypothetical protein
MNGLRRRAPPWAPVNLTKSAILRHWPLQEPTPQQRAATQRLLAMITQATASDGAAHRG